MTRRALWDNCDEWDVQTDGRIAHIANRDAIHPDDIADAKENFPTICGECGAIRTPSCSRCFWINLLLIHDTVFLSQVDELG